jgi:hypothetical protein
MAWRTPLKKVVASRLLPRPWWMTQVRQDRRTWVVTLECGHEVKRNTYGDRQLPKRCKCTKCQFHIKDFPEEKNA